MSRTENVELTVLCLIEDGNKILLQRRTGKGTHCRAGMWNPENLLLMQ